MYSITPVSPNKHLVAYLAKPVIKAINFVGNHYTLGGKTVGGLLPTLTSTYYPTYEPKKRQYKRKGVTRHRKASTKKQGIAVDNQLQEYVRSKKRPRNALAKAIIAYLEDGCNQTIQAAQVPVVIRDFDKVKVSQADIITQDKDGRLYMVEVKTGYNQSRSQGNLEKLADVPNNRKNHWELQRHFTHRGLVAGGLPIEASYIVNAYQEDDKVTVKKRKNPSWVKQLK